MKEDPVCKMKIEPAHAAAQAQHHGKTFYFCSNDCKSKFEANPERFAH